MVWSNSHGTQAIASTGWNGKAAGIYGHVLAMRPPASTRMRRLLTSRIAEMVTRPSNVNAYQFVVLSALRAQQLLAGSVPRLPGDHSAVTMAQMEVADGCVTGAEENSTAPRQCGWQR